MDPAEKETRRLLKSEGAEFIRKSGNSHEVWRLPNGSNFICHRTGRKIPSRSWKNNLSDLKRKLRTSITPPPPAPMPEPPLVTIAPRVKKAPVFYQRVSELPPAPEPLPAPPTPVEPPKPKEKRMGGRLYSKAEKKKVKRLWEAGDTDEAIAEAISETRPDTTAVNVASLRNRERWLRRQPPEGTKRGTATVLSNAPKVSASKAPKAPQPDNGFELIIRFPNGREARSPLSKRQAEEMALRILTGDL